MNRAGNEGGPQKGQQASNTNHNGVRPMLDEDEVIRRTDRLAESITQVILHKHQAAQNRRASWGLENA